MKKFLIVIIIVFIVAIVFFMMKNNKKEISNSTVMENSNIIEDNKIANDSVNKNIVEKHEEIEKEEISNMNEMYIKVNNQTLEVELENNQATRELKEKLESEDIVIKAHEYGGFEKVGDLGFTLPREDTNITTEAGDIVLYQGNQVSLFYNSNSWSYTKLGKVKNISSSKLKNILGTGDVTILFTLSK